METYAVYLKPKSSFITWPASDTIFGAICWAVYHLYGKPVLEEMLNDFNSKPKFVLSSAFPYLQHNGSKVHFFPKPLLGELKSGDIEKLVKQGMNQIVKSGEEALDFKRSVVSVSQDLKHIKKVSYVSEALFKEIVDGSLTLREIYHRLKKKGAISKDIEKLGNSLISFDEREKIDPEGDLKTLQTEADVQRNQIDRVAGSTVEGLLFFNKETLLHRDYGGLWFLIETDDLEFLKPLLRYLQDTGIGGERTSGKGHFEITWDENPYKLPCAKNANVFITLSRYLPSEEERNFDKNFASWNLLNLRQKRETMYLPKGKFISKDLLRMFSEGSVFPLRKRGEYYGQIEQIEFSGANPVFRNGLALPIFAKIGG